MNINENILDNSIIKIYKEAFKERGVIVKDFEIIYNKAKKERIFNIIISKDAEYWVKWVSNISLVHYVSIIEGLESEVKSIRNPDVYSISDAICNDYKKQIKKKNFIVQLINLMFNR